LFGVFIELIDQVLGLLLNVHNNVMPEAVEHLLRVAVQLEAIQKVYSHRGC